MTDASVGDSGLCNCSSVPSSSSAAVAPGDHMSVSSSYQKVNRLSPNSANFPSWLAAGWGPHTHPWPQVLSKELQAVPLRSDTWVKKVLELFTWSLTENEVQLQEDHTPQQPPEKVSSWREGSLNSGGATWVLSCLGWICFYLHFGTWS